MTDKELRQWCLKYAADWFAHDEHGLDLDEVMALAKRLWDFIDRAHVAE
jgi:hypothetical protein